MPMNEPSIDMSQQIKCGKARISPGSRRIYCPLNFQRAMKTYNLDKCDYGGGQSEERQINSVFDSYVLILDEGC